MRGTTLIELLIAMTLAGLAIAGAITGFSQVQRAWHDAETQGTLHERAQYVFATLEPELQMAGYYGPQPRPAFTDVAALPAGALLCGAAALTQLDDPIEVHSGWRLPCAAQGQGAMPGRNVLIVRRASVDLSTSPPGPIRILGSVASPAMRRIEWPGFPAAPPAPLAPGTELRDLLVRIYYVSRASDGDDATPALRVKSLTAIAGQPAFIDTEVMPGVEDLQVELLPSLAGTESARVTLRVRVDTADSRPGEVVPAITLVRRFGLRNASSV